MNQFQFFNLSVDPLFLLLALSTAIVAFIAYLIYQQISRLVLDLKDYFQQISKQNADQLEQEAQDEILRKQRNWFAKNANVSYEDGRPKYRTVTLTRAIIEASKVNTLVTLLKQMPKTDMLNFTSRNNPLSVLEFTENNQTLIEAVAENDLGDYDAATLAQIAAAFADYVEIDLGISLGDVCLCDGGYCDWEADMFTSFIVDTEKFKFKKITITQIVDDGQEVNVVISESTDTRIGFGDLPFEDKSDYSPDGRYLSVVMSHQDDLMDLTYGDVVKIKFEWCDADDNRLCAVLINTFPPETTLTDVSTNTRSGVPS